MRWQNERKEIGTSYGFFEGVLIACTPFGTLASVNSACVWSTVRTAPAYVSGPVFLRMWMSFAELSKRRRNSWSV